MTIRGFGRGRGKKRDPGTPNTLFTNISPPVLTQAELSNNFNQINHAGSFPSSKPPLNTHFTSPTTTNGFHSDSVAPPSNTLLSDSYNDRPPDTNSSQVILVDERKVGRIIGSRGATITRLEEETGAKIDISHDCNDNFEKEVTISGPGSAVQSAVQMIDDIIRDNRSGGGGSRESATNHSDSVEVIRVGSSSVGRIIGRSGCTINQIRDDTGVKIDIGEDTIGGYDKEVTLTGSLAGIAEAKRMISELVAIISDNGGDNGGDKGSVDYAAPIDWGQLAANEERNRQERWGVLPPVNKDFYTELPEVSRLSDVDVARIRAQNMAIEVSHYIRDEDKEKPEVYKPIPKPCLTFEHAFHRYPDILREIYKQGFTEPSPIQKQMWPILLSGHDCIGVAQTGTGKTLAFLLPAFIHIEAQATPRSQRVGPTVFCLAPTRELALQIKWEVDKYSYHGISSACVYGGGDRSEQVQLVKRGVDIVVATPGRLNDLIESKILNLDSCSYLILDEADRMLDMGFEPQIKKTLLDIRPDRHSVMTSATWPPGVRRIAHEYMNNSIIVNVGSLDLKAASTVTQQVIMTTVDEKLGILQDIVETQIDHTKHKCLIFVGKKITADFISSEFITRYMRPELAHLQIKSDAIHGDRDQCDREAALGGFKEGDISVLIATDVASRGLDVRGVTHVVNYDFPRDMEDYVHRVGRTGRAGREGTAVSLITREDWRKAGDLVKILSDSQQHVPNELVVMAERWARKKAERDREGGRRGDFGGGRSRYR